MAFCLMAFCVVTDAKEPGPLRVLRYDSDESVSEIVVHGRFVNGNQLRALYELLGVSKELLETESSNAAKDLFILLRIESTKSAGGVPSGVELQIANESPLLSDPERLIKVPLLLDGPYVVVQKIVGPNASRSGAFSGMSESAPSSCDTTDHVGKLGRELPFLRLRSMIIK